MSSRFLFKLNNRVFLSRNYRLIVAPRKFDVLKTNICPRSEASRANMLVLRTSNFQGATIRPIVPRHKHKRKRDVSGITPSSVDKKQTLEFTSKTVNVRPCYGVDAPDKYCARTLSLFCGSMY